MLLFTGELELEVASPIESNGWTGKARSCAPTDILQRTKYHTVMALKVPV